MLTYTRRSLGERAGLSARQGGQLSYRASQSNITLDYYRGVSKFIFRTIGLHSVSIPVLFYPSQGTLFAHQQL